MKNQVLYFKNPQEIAILEEEIPSPNTDEVLVKTLKSAISAGTEMLFYRGLMPQNLASDETIPSLKPKPVYPFKYGYCAVGKVMEAGSAQLEYLIGQTVFVFNPHESYFCAKESQLILLPEEISMNDALFLANMETAVNLVLDGSPLIGERVLVLGLGIVGLLTTALLEQFPLSSLLGSDFYCKRRDLGKELGADFTFSANPSDLQNESKPYLDNIDLIYELSGNPEALNSAIAFAAYEGRIILGSWYGRKPCSIHLGEKFHRNRIKIVASQVSTLASKFLGRWDKSRRFAVTFKMLEKIKPSRFISHEFNIQDAQQAYQLLDKNPEDTLALTLTYEV